MALILVPQNTITIPTNFGPVAGEQTVSFPQRSFQFADGSVTPGRALFDQNGVNLDCEVHNMAMVMLANDEEDVEATPDVDGVTYLGISPGYS